MKTTFTILVCLFISIIASYGQVKFAIKAGPSLNVVHYKVKISGDAQLFDNKNKIGFQLGGIINYHFKSNLGIQTGLLFSSKGSAYDLEESLKDGYIYQTVEVGGYDRSTLNYFEIPIQGIYNIKNFQILGGPYVAFCLGGKHKSDYWYTVDGLKTVVKNTRNVEPVFGSVEFRYDKSYINALDLGAKFGVGYQFKPFIINVEYALGLKNLSPKITGSGLIIVNPDVPPGAVHTVPTTTSTNRSLSFTIGYVLGK